MTLDWAVGGSKTDIAFRWIPLIAFVLGLAYYAGELSSRLTTVEATLHARAPLAEDFIAMRPMIARMERDLHAIRGDLSKMERKLDGIAYREERRRDAPARWPQPEPSP